MDWPRKAFLPSNKPFLHNSRALLRIAERERRKVFAICMADWVGHSLMSVLISSSVQGSRHSSSVMLRPCCAGPFWRAYGGIGGRQM